MALPLRTLTAKGWGFMRLRRRGSRLEFVVFPMDHVAMPSSYEEVARRLRECDLLVVTGADWITVVAA